MKSSQRKDKEYLLLIMNTIPFIFIPIGFKQLAAFVLFAAPRGNLMRSDGDKPKSSGFMSGIYFLTGHIYVTCQRICCTVPPYLHEAIFRIKREPIYII